MPSFSESQSGSDPQFEEILTLAEAATYLRVDEAGLEKMADGGDIPARKVAGQWRFSRRALEAWLRFPGLHPAEYIRFSHRWLEEPPFMEEMFRLFEKRILLSLARAKTEEEGPRRGTKQAVLKRFGILRNADDMEEQLAATRKLRETGG